MWSHTSSAPWCDYPALASVELAGSRAEVAPLCRVSWHISIPSPPEPSGWEMLTALWSLGRAGSSTGPAGPTGTSQLPHAAQP